jgi:WD domain, G-beta repeat
VGQTAATDRCHDLQAIVWDTATGRPIRQLKHLTTSEQQGVTVGWSPDGSMLATAGGGGTVLLWRTSTWQQLATLPADTSIVLCLAFSPDGSVLAAGGVGDRAVTLWDVATHRQVGRLPHPTFLASVAFDPAGKTLATATVDDKVRLWDLASSRQIGVALPGAENGSGSNVAAFDPSGNHLIALHDSGTAFVWDLGSDRWKQQACAVVGRSLSLQEWKDLLPGRRYQPACRVRQPGAGGGNGRDRQDDTVARGSVVRAGTKSSGALLPRGGIGGPALLCGAGSIPWSGPICESRCARCGHAAPARRHEAMLAEA